MRELVKEFVRMAAETLPVQEPIFEFGAFQVPGQEVFADLRPLFPGRSYVGCDVRQGPGVDRILDLHNIELPNESVGTVLVMDTLQNVEMPWRALQEVQRILRPQGLVLISSHMNHPLSAWPVDYWRFTPDGFRTLLKPFSISFVGWAGEEAYPHTVVGHGVKGNINDNIAQAFANKYEEWQKRWFDERPRSWRKFVKPFVPPIVVAAYRRLRVPSHGR